MTGSPIVEIRERGRGVRRLVLDRAVEIGRDCDGENLQDEAVSRRHVRLVPSPVALSLVDLGSRNGTWVNGMPVTGRVTLEPGDVVRLGGAEIVMIGREQRAAVPSVAGSADRATAVAVDLPLLAPPPPAPSTPPSRVRRTVDAVLGRSDTVPAFPVYTELPSHVPPVVWVAARVVSVTAYVTLVALLLLRPTVGLFVLFDVIVPLLPLLFFVAPGLWRNICPLAAANQTPRVVGFSRARTVPNWVARHGYLVAMALFFTIAAARLALFNSNGPATAVLLAAVIGTALVMGFVYQGKSGWCSSICPLLPLQRAYGQTPFATVPNSHCQPCLACTRNCYDFRPGAAYQADMREPDPSWTAPRRLFVAALPGFVLGFFMLLGAPAMPGYSTYGHLALYFLGSVGLFYAADALTSTMPALVVTVWAALAINIFYWFAVPVTWLQWPVRAVVLVLSLLWIARTLVKSAQFRQETMVPEPAPAPEPVLALDPADTAVRFAEHAEPLATEPGTNLLEAAERAGLPIEAGCRMGVCGSDPVAVLDGMAGLTPPDEEELNTLRRLGLAANTRMACSARVERGCVSVSVTPEPGDGVAAVTPTRYDRSIVSVVVLGNGIAGVTAADFVRRGHPDCEIHIVGRESHVLYNRMGISRLVFGRSAMQGLHLLPEDWYDAHDITAWLNTVATEIDLPSRRVLLGTGEALPFDRLVLAMGSSSARPPVDGIGKPGSFVLRSAADAIDIRGYAQEHRCQEAVVAGGGLLGLEAAYALRELGTRVTVLERADRLLHRQVDERCSEHLHAYLAAIGVRVRYRAQAVALTGSEIDGVLLADGGALRCDLFLAAVGIRPNTELARRAGVTVNRGIVVNDRMETDVPGVYAAGDVAEHAGQVVGLWPVAAKQGEVAALNALGEDRPLTPERPATILKGVGVELFAVGTTRERAGDDVVVADEPALPSYRKLLVRRGHAVGGIVLGHHPEDVAAVGAAVRGNAAVGPGTLAELRRGNWRALVG